jgi:hypothetical protein
MAGNQVKTAASQRLERTKRWNLAGVIVTVGSSTLLYINVIAYLVVSYFRHWTMVMSTWGNPLTFGCFLDSMLNTLGMILLSGMFKDASFSCSLPSFLSTKRSSKGPVSVRPAVDFVPNSQASSIYVHNET